MKSTALVRTAMMALVAVFCLITGNGFSEAWAKGSGGSHGTTSRITQPGNTQPSSEALKPYIKLKGQKSGDIKGDVDQPQSK